MSRTQFSEFRIENKTAEIYDRIGSQLYQKYESHPFYTSDIVDLICHFGLFDKNCHTYLNACKYEHYHILAYLLKINKYPKIISNDAIRYIVMNQKIETLNYLIENGITFQWHAIYLIYATELGYIDIYISIMESLHQHSSNLIYLIDQSLYIPFQCGDLDVIKFLYVNSEIYNINLFSYRNLYYKVATQYGHKHILEYMDKITLIDEYDKIKSLISAINNDHYEVIYYLLENINISLYREWYYKIYIPLIKKNNIELISVFLEAHNRHNKYDLGPNNIVLETAICYDMTDIIKYFIDNKIMYSKYIAERIINNKTYFRKYKELLIHIHIEEDFYPLLWFAINHNCDAAEYILQLCVNEIDFNKELKSIKKYMCPRVVCPRAACPRIIKLLLEYGADINIIDNSYVELIAKYDGQECLIYILGQNSNLSKRFILKLSIKYELHDVVRYFLNNMVIAQKDISYMYRMLILHKCTIDNFKIFIAKYGNNINTIDGFAYSVKYKHIDVLTYLKNQP